MRTNGQTRFCCIANRLMKTYRITGVKAACDIGLIVEL